METLSDNLVNEVDAIIFYDDNVNSGSQLINIFAARLGVNLPTRHKLHEAHGSRLSNDAGKRLQKLPMHFVYGVAPESVPTRIQEQFEKLFGIPRGNVTMIGLHWLKESEKTLSGHDSSFQHAKREELRKFLVAVGTDLMISEGKTDEVARNRALGDENAEALIVFPYNVPTMTILPLWCEGNITKGDLAGTAWSPLVERRRSRDLDGKFVGDDA